MFFLFGGSRRRFLGHRLGAGVVGAAGQFGVARPVRDEAEAGLDRLAGDDAAVAEAMARPERLAARLFSLRAEGLVNSLSAVTARARLSGLLIGAELAGAKRYWLGQRVRLIGTAGLVASYARALAAQGVTADLLPAAECTLAGLAVASGKAKA